MFFQEKRDCVLGFVNEKHLKHYISILLKNEHVQYLSGTTLTEMTDLDKLRVTGQLTDFQYNDLFYKDFVYTGVPASPKDLEKEVVDWSEWIGAESEFSVLATFYDELKGEFSCLLLQGRQNEYMLTHQREESENICEQICR